MISKNALVCAIGLTVLFVHIEADKLAGSIRGEEGRELAEPLWHGDEYYYEPEKKSGSKGKGGSKSGSKGKGGSKSDKGGSKSDKGGRCESHKSGGYRRELGYYEPPPPPGPAPDSKICKVFDFLDDHKRRRKGSYCPQGQRCDQPVPIPVTATTQTAARRGYGYCPEFDVEEYCHLIDTLHPDFNDMVCPCPYETVYFPYYYGESYRKQGYGKYPPHKEEKVCQPKNGGGYQSTRKSYDRINDINRYGKFCSKALGFKFEPKQPRYDSRGTEVAYYDDHDDDDCFEGCRKYVKYCCCEFGDSGKHYY